SPRFGIFAAKAGPFAPVETGPTHRLAAGYSDPTTEAKPGTRSHRRTAKVFPKNHMVESRLQLRHLTRSAFTRPSNRPTAHCSFPMMAAAPGTSGTRASGWSGVRSISLI